MTTIVFVVFVVVVVVVALCVYSARARNFVCIFFIRAACEKYLAYKYGMDNTPLCSKNGNGNWILFHLPTSEPTLPSTKMCVEPSE